MGYFMLSVKIQKKSSIFMGGVITSTLPMQIKIYAPHNYISQLNLTIRFFETLQCTVIAGINPY